MAKAHPIRLRRAGRPIGKTVAKELIKKRAATKRTTVAVGFFQEDRYPNGDQVARIAAINEFGAPRARIPMRPALRIANQTGEETVSRIIRQTSSRSHGGITEQGARYVGTFMVGTTRQSIMRLHSPKNAPYTIQKKGFNNPLVETRHMERSVQAKIEE